MVGHEAFGDDLDVGVEGVYALCFLTDDGAELGWDDDGCLGVIIQGGQVA